jgi:DNA gyrase/topoisomerase IV subunit A
VGVGEPTRSRGAECGRRQDADARLGPPAEAPLAHLAASTRDNLYLFTTSGDALALPVHRLPGGVAWEGEVRSGLSCCGENGHRLVPALAAPNAPPGGGTVFLVTAQGQVKRVAPEELPAVGAS